MSTANDNAARSRRGGPSTTKSHKSKTMGSQPGPADRKHEGFSDLKGAVEEQSRKLGKDMQRDQIEKFEDEYIDNLHKQVALMERELECLK